MALTPESEIDGESAIACSSSTTSTRPCLAADFAPLSVAGRWGCNVRTFRWVFIARWHL